MIDEIVLIQNDTKPSSYYTSDVKNPFATFGMDTIGYFVGFNKNYANLNKVKGLFEKGIAIIMLNGIYDAIIEKYYNWF